MTDPIANTEHGAPAAKFDVAKAKAAAANLSDAKIRSAKPKDRAWKLGASRGLYLLITVEGGKLWRFDYQVKGGKRKTLSIGRYPDITLAAATSMREEYRKQVAQGIDPGAEKREAKQQKDAEQELVINTFEAFTRTWMERESAKLADVTANKNRWLFETYIFPAIGHLQLHEVTPALLLDVLGEIEASGKQETAHRCKVKVGQVYRRAMLEGRATMDPTAPLRGEFGKVRGKHQAAVTDPVKIGELLRKIDGYSGMPVTVAAMKLSPLVFVRPGELRSAEWAEIDMDGAVWRIPGHKMKMKRDHIVPLSTQAVAILRDLHNLTGHGRYLFPSARGASRFMSENAVTAALRGMGYLGNHARDDKDAASMTGHGFRRMASTRLHEMGWSSDVIELQLAHAEQDEVKAAYNAAERLPARKEMMQAWADYLDALRASSNVVAIRSIVAVT
jgi:integrase